jgi:hypothetical protein
MRLGPPFHFGRSDVVRSSDELQETLSGFALTQSLSAFSDLRTGVRRCKQGADAVREKLHLWFDASSIEDFKIEGPFVTGDQFAVPMEMVMSTVQAASAGAGRSARPPCIPSRTARSLRSGTFIDGGKSAFDPKRTPVVTRLLAANVCCNRAISVHRRSR